VGKAFIYLETVQTNASKYLHLGPCEGLFLAHRLQISHTVLLMFESLGHKNAGPRWSQELSALSEVLHLTNVGPSDSGMAMWQSVNFHLPSSRKFPPSLSNQACFCEVYHGSHSDKGHKNKAADSETEVCPLGKAAHLASLSAFWFPEQLSSPPSGALRSV
jgi:hypothetical protein